MRNEKRKILEIIDGFKNLTYKIKKDNDDIKQSIKNKDATIASCKTEYQKLYANIKSYKKDIMNWKSIFYNYNNNNNKNYNNNNNNNIKNKRKIYRFTLIKKENIIW